MRYLATETLTAADRFARASVLLRCVVGPALAADER